MKSFLEEVRDNETVIAIIIRSQYRNEGISFFTPGDFSQQLAYMHHTAGKEIQPHVHNIINREVSYTQEVLVVKSGRVKVDLFTAERAFLATRVLEAGDLILLAAGGHGFTMLEETEMFEIKQGPYAGEADKERF
jgi:mannose-6-phosphate isomerase-like protein (cupin superfamily)